MNQITSSAVVLRKFLEPVSRYGMFISGAAIVAVMAFTVTNILSRFIFNYSLAGTIELVRITMIIVVFAGMAYTNLRGGHIKVSVLVDRLSTTLRLSILTCAFFLATAIVFIVAWQSVVQANFLLDWQMDSGLLGIKLWPFAAATAGFMVLFGFTLLADFLGYLGELIDTRSWKRVIIPGVVALALLGIAMWTQILPNLKPAVFGVIAILFLFSLIFSEVYVGAAMALTALFGVNYLAVQGSGLAVLGMMSQTIASHYNWSVFPMFMFMGLIVFKSGFSRDIFRTVRTWLGHVAGGLASATVGACGLFAAVVGDSTSGVLTMGTLALPEMRKYRYSTKLATGCIAAGSSIGILIPPSIGLMTYGILTEQSIGKLFIAGIIPGIIVTIAFMILITVRCSLNPALGPPGPSTSFKEKLVSIKSIWIVVTLFTIAIGGIYTGIFTVTEAGAAGAFAAIIIAVATRRLNFKSFTEANAGTVKIISMIFFIFIYANSVTQFFAMTNIPFALAEFVSELPVPPVVTIIVFLFFYLIGGCLMNTLPLLILTIPIMFPVVMALGFDPIWFGIVVEIGSETGQLTPPIGMSVFAMHGIAPDVKLYDIFRGVTPFWLVLLGVLALLVAFPQIVLFLPNAMYT